MNSLMSQIISVLGEAPNDTIEFFYYLLASFIVIISIKIVFKVIFDYILNIKL